LELLFLGFHHSTPFMKISRIIPFAILTLAFLSFFSSLIFGGETLFFRDSLILDQPLKYFYRTNFSFGPALWNPYISSGFPSFAAPHHALFYPLNILLFVGSFSTGYSIFVTVHFLLGSLFTYHFSKSIGAETPGAILSALCFNYSGFMLFTIHGVNHYATPIWLPAILLAIVKFKHSKNIMWLSLATVFGSFQILSGESHFTLFSFLLVFLYSIYSFKKPKPILWVLLFLGLSILICGIQILPTLDFTYHFSSRSQGLSFFEATQWSFYPLRILEFFFPLYFGNITPSANFYWGKFIYEQLNNHPFIISVYFGVIPTAILISQGKSIFKNKTFFWALAGVFALILSFGKFLPGYFWIRQIPFLSLLRFPEKFLMITIFSWSIAAGLLLPAILKGSKRSFQITVGGLIGYLAFLAIHSFFFETLWTNIPSNLIQQSLYTSYRSILHGAAILLFLSFLLYFFKRSPRKVFLTWMIITLCFFDLWVAGRAVLYTAPKSLKAIQTPWLSSLKERNLFRFARSDKLFARAPIDPNEKNYLITEAKTTPLTLRPNWGIFSKIHYSRGYDGLRLKVQDELFSSEKNFRNTLNRTGTRWYLSGKNEVVPKDFISLYESENLGIQLWENPKSLPRAYFIGENPILSSIQEGLQFFPNPIPADIQWLKDSPDEIILKSRVSTPKAYLILNDHFYPGWRVFVNGLEKPIVKAFGFSRAVLISQGDSEIRWVFQPKSLTYGKWLSLFGLATLISLMVFRKQCRVNGKPVS